MSYRAATMVLARERCHARGGLSRVCACHYVPPPPRYETRLPFFQDLTQSRSFKLNQLESHVSNVLICYFLPMTVM